jgi:hypothetical protein
MQLKMAVDEQEKIFNETLMGIKQSAEKSNKDSQPLYDQINNLNQRFS